MFKFCPQSILNKTCTWCHIWSWKKKF